jgi:short subunit dehydrogenase-like uncharacterized protein
VARDLDVVVLGASSVTGRRVAAYLSERATETGASWAAAGRDEARVAAALADAGAQAPETLTADVADPDSLAAMAARAHVVLNLVGPYTLHGRPVIEACVEGGAHYVDLTGEIPFARRVIKDFDDRAREAGVKVVQVCGFESLPPDLAVALAAAWAQDRGEALAEADVEIVTERAPMPPRPSDFMSGGTMQSLAAAAGDEDAPAVTDPACLVDDPELAEEIRRRSPITLAPRRGHGGAVIAPMVPAAFINPQVVHRSVALRGRDRPDRTEPLRYREGLAIAGPAATAPLRYAVAGMLAAPQLGLSKLAKAPLATRKRLGAALGRALPGSGFGPAPHRLEGWRWRLRLYSRTGAGAETTVEALDD